MKKLKEQYNEHPQIDCLKKYFRVSWKHYALHSWILWHLSTKNKNIILYSYNAVTMVKICNIEYRVDPHYLQIPYLQIHLLITFIFNPKINTSSVFLVIYGHVHVQSGKKFELPSTYINTHIPRWDQTKWHSDCMFQIEYCKHTVLYPFCDIFSVTGFAFLCFLLVISVFKWSPGIVLKYYLVFLSTGSLGCALWRKYVR